MKIHTGKLTMEALSMSVIDILCISTKTNQERWNEANFVHKKIYTVMPKYGKITKYKIYETFKKCFGTNLLNQIHNVVII